MPNLKENLYFEGEGLPLVFTKNLFRFNSVSKKTQKNLKKQVTFVDFYYIIKNNYIYLFYRYL